VAIVAALLASSSAFSLAGEACISKNLSSTSQLMLGEGDLTA